MCCSPSHNRFLCAFPTLPFSWQNQTLPKLESISPSPSGITRNDREHLVSGLWIPDLPSQCSLLQPHSSASTSAEDKDDKSRLRWAVSVCGQQYLAPPPCSKARGSIFLSCFCHWQREVLRDFPEHLDNPWLISNCAFSFTWHSYLIFLLYL